MKIDVKIFYDRIKSKVSWNKERAQKVVDATVINDSSRFVPFETTSREKWSLRKQNPLKPKGRDNKNVFKNR